MISSNCISINHKLTKCLHNTPVIHVKLNKCLHNTPVIYVKLTKCLHNTPVVRVKLNKCLHNTPVVYVKLNKCTSINTWHSSFISASLGINTQIYVICAKLAHRIGVLRQVRDYLDLGVVIMMHIAYL